MDLYELLDVAHGASRYEVEKANDRKNSAGGADKTKAYAGHHLAYYVLSDIDKRQAYDAAPNKEEFTAQMENELRLKVAYEIAHGLMTSKKSESQTRSFLIEQDFSTQEAQAAVQRASSELKGISKIARTAALRSIGISMLWIVGGVVLTFLSALLFEAFEYPVYISFSVLSLYGIIRLIRSVFRLVRGR